ncbi:MAG TPA: fatty acid--CoA ligase family protein [Thermoanaerobaculia bacterium]|nr:fatty acid--CoA ligase family protein [Thermoanaerobaculia bacterium]
MFRDPILEAFDHLCRRRPGSPLVASPTRRVTAAEVADLAAAAAAGLDAARLPPGTVVGLAAPDGAAFLASFVALRRRELVPLLLEWRSPAAERDRIADGLGSSWTLTCRRRWPARPGDWQLAGRGPRSRTAAGLRLDPGTAAVKLTSGSTGRPRGIVTPAEALFADDAALARTMGLSAEERIAGAIPLSHSYGLSSVALPALVRGSLLVVAEEGSGPYGPLHAARALEATFLPTVPAFLRALLASDRPPPLPASLRLTITAGAPLQPETAARFREVYGRPVHVFYGSSESGGICFDREGGAGERGSVGTPVEGVRVSLAADEGEPTAGDDPAEVGVVTVESASVAAGYLPADDARLGAGRFRTGDVGSWRGGELHLVGRTDDLINVRGKKVNPREVEAVLSGLAGVRDVVAVGTEEAEPALRVVVACDPGEISPGRVLEWCRERLAEHKVPRSVVLVDAIPRTSRGKVDREAVLALRPRGVADALRPQHR